MEGFSVQPEQLTQASQAMRGYCDSLAVARGDVALTLPPAAFGQLPESAELAAALEHSVRCSTGDLDGAVDVATNISTGLDDGAQSYARLDAECAEQMYRLIA